MHRDAPPLLPSDTTQGYRTVKAKLGCKKVRPWKWMPFTNPARRDGAIFHHWRRVAEEGKDYPFARFNKVGMTTVSSSVWSLVQYKHQRMDFYSYPYFCHRLLFRRLFSVIHPASLYFLCSLACLYRQCRYQCTQSRSIRYIFMTMAGLKQRQTTCLTCVSASICAS